MRNGHRSGRRFFSKLLDLPVLICRSRYKRGMLFADLVETSRKVASTSKRLEKIQILSQFLAQLHPDEAEAAVAFLSGLTRQGRIGAGYALIRELASPPALNASLMITEVDAVFAEFLSIQGVGSVKRKRDLMHSVFSRSTSAEQQFLTGLLLGEIRQGALEGVMVDALARAAGIHPDRLRRAVMLGGSVIQVARSVLESGEEGLEKFGLTLFQPVQPMLAQTSEDPDEALQEFGEAAFEYKFDGARVQVHRQGDDVRVFSRALNDITAAVPEVVEAALALPARNLILDGEVISLMGDGRPRPFQMTARRFGRKLDLERMRAELPLTPVWFDLLYLDGGSLIDEPQVRRFQSLRSISPSVNLIPHLMTSDPEEASGFLTRALSDGHEGVMAKAPGSFYSAGARGQSWKKIKKIHTLDLVVLAAEWGSGRRKGWLSNLHLGARDTEKGGFAMLGKTFKGMTDEMLAWQTEQFLKLETMRDEYTVYVEPKLVVEIAFNDIHISSRYPSGLALRFARVKRYRTDKTPEETDTYQTVLALAGNQHVV